MFGNDFSCFSLWWLIPLAMMLLCFFMMGRKRGAWMCGMGGRHVNGKEAPHGESAQEILDKRYARGEIDQEEYKTKKAIIDPKHR